MKTSFKSSNFHFCCNFYLQGHCCKKVIDVGLYNITADPYEMVNLRKKFPDIVEALMTRVEFYRQSAVPPENKPSESLAWIMARMKRYWGPWKDWGLISAFLWKGVLKQPRRQRQRERQLKSEFVLFQTSLVLFHFLQIVNCWGSFLELTSKNCV